MEHTADLVQGIPGNYVFDVLQSSGSYLAGWFRETLGDPKLLGAPDPALDEALEGADTVIVSVASVGVEQVVKMALPGIVKADALMVTSKGFLEFDNGDALLLPNSIRRIAADEGYDNLPPIIAVAGPAKANECAAREPTATIFGCKDLDVAIKYARAIRTDNYAIEATDDETGVEICAPMKNVFAIALGIADGLQEKTGVPHHNLKAATFNEAVREMSILGTSQGANEMTAFGLPGVGDLEVTGLSGRNKFYGVRIGQDLHHRRGRATDPLYKARSMLAHQILPTHPTPATSDPRPVRQRLPRRPRGHLERLPEHYRCLPRSQQNPR